MTQAQSTECQVVRKSRPTLLKIVLMLSVLSSSWIASGCATITVGRHQEIQIITSPTGAKASTGGMSITTPGNMTLRRDSNHVILIEKDGYLAESVSLTSGLGPAVAGNIIFGGLIGWGIDAASGAQYKLYPESINVSLKPNGASTPAAIVPTLPEAATPAPEVEPLASEEALSESAP